MTIQQLTSLLATISMASAFFASKIHLRKFKSIVYIFQIFGYVLYAISSYLIGFNSAALVLLVCAVTLVLKMLRRYSSLAMALFWSCTLAGCLMLNAKGWQGIIPIIAGLDVIYRHAYNYRAYFPIGLIPITQRQLRDELRKHYVVILSEIDNANRQSGNAFSLFVENIIDVILWIIYAKTIGDIGMLVWRCIMLGINLVDYVKRLLPRIIDAIEGKRRGKYKRYRYPGRGKRRDYTI